MERMQIADPLPRKNRGLDRAHQLRATEVRPSWVELIAPASQLGNRLGLQLAVELAPARRIEFRRREQGLDQCLDVQARSADDDWLLVVFACALDSCVGV